MAAGTYDLLREYSSFDGDDDLSHAPHWVLAVARLGKPLSYSRASKGSTTTDSSEGAKLRGRVLVITDDCLQLQVEASKENHLQALTASLIETGTNYLVQLLPGDWVMAWIVHGRDARTRLVRQIRQGKQSNKFGDGLKFVGRIESVRKRVSRGERARTARVQVTAYGFRELDTQVFYDQFLSTNSDEAQDLGRWLARVGLDIEQLFGVSADGLKDNVHLLIPALLELLVGRGFSSDVNPVSGETSLQAFTGGGPAGSSNPLGLDAISGVGDTVQPAEAPFAYLVPREVGDLLGRKNSSKPGGILAYADVLDVLFGVQRYDGNGADQASVFVPQLASSSPLSVGTHKFTGIDMMGSFLPQMPEFTNQPLWSVLQQYLNPVVNEMYTALRVNEVGDVVPTVVLRQIPFTTPVLAKKIDQANSTASALDAGGQAGGLAAFVGAGGSAAGGGDAGGAPAMPYTGYYDLPRWVLPSVMVPDVVDLGRSDAARCNFVHVFGQAAQEAINQEVTYQLVNNPPVRDDLDIQRSGLHSFMATVACRALNQVGTTPGLWMELIADHRIGAQWTLNGTVESFGIQAPICPGDNLEFEGVVYHLEGVRHAVGVDAAGNRSWRTSLSLSNGLLGSGDDVADFPAYAGLDVDDLTDLDPGVSADGSDEDPDPEVPSAPFKPTGEANS